MDEVRPRDASWRRRHPTLSRGLLYGAGALLAAVTVALLSGRRERDREDHLVYLEARLTALDLVLASDPTGQEVLGILDEEFADPTLPADIRQRAQRARAFAEVKGGRRTEALAALDVADALAPDPVARDAIRIERGQVLAALGAPEEALGVLEAEAVGAQPVLAVWRGLARAQALHAMGRAEAGTAQLDQALGGLAGPLPEGPEVLVGQTAWTPARAALFATQALSDLAPNRGAEPWLRLLALAPEDFRALVEVARRLGERGHPAAARAWARARSLNAAEAEALAAQDPVLGRLSAADEEGVQPEGPNRR